MIFNISDDFETIESYKERNLYYKIFAGYLFNELISGEDARKNLFIDKLKFVLNEKDRVRDSENKIPALLSAISGQPFHVTFDYHSSQILKSDRGEMSDILLLTSTHFLSIECKFLKDMQINEDVLWVQERIKLVADKLSLQPLQILLMKSNKWTEVKKMQKHKKSFYTAFQDAGVQIPVLVLFWEDLVSLIENDEVKDYLNRQLKRNNKKPHARKTT